MAYPLLDIGPGGALDGVKSAAKGFVIQCVTVLLTAGSLYAARYHFDPSSIDLTSRHDLTALLAYTAWLLFVLFARKWLPAQSGTMVVPDLSEQNAAG